MDDKNEIPSKREGKRRILPFLLGALAVFLLLIFAGSPAISTALKNILLPELQSLLGEDIAFGDFRLNYFPLSLEARDVVMSDAGGNQIAGARQVKGYVSLSGLPNKTLFINRLVLKEVNVTASRQKIEDVIKHVQSTLERQRKGALKVKIKVVQIASEDMHIIDHDLNADIRLQGLSGELIAGEAQRVKMAAREVVMERAGWPKIVFDINAAAVVKPGRITINHLQVGALGSSLKGEGLYAHGKGALTARLSLLANSVKQLFGLEGKGDGHITAQGEIRIADNDKTIPSLRIDRPGPRSQIEAPKVRFPGKKDIFIDLKIEGNFFIETLMELLKVKERVEGLVDLDGEIKGPLSDLSGRARATLQKGNLFTVDIDSLKCNIVYKNGLMSFHEGFGRLYNGTARAEAFIRLPVVTDYAVNVMFQAIDSQGAFKLIHWDPGIPNGKVDGELRTAGARFSPEGWFFYKGPAAQRADKEERQPSSDDVLNRIVDIRGNYSLKGDSLSLSDLQINSGISRVSAEGTIDLREKLIRLSSKLATGDVSDLTSPYYGGVRGRGEFSGQIGGSFDDPVISGTAAIRNPVVEKYSMESFAADFSYKKNLLHLRDAVFRERGEEHRFKGSISFPHARKLFEFGQPVYDLNAKLARADFENTVRIFFRDFTGRGVLSGDFKMGGKDSDIHISGKATVENGSLSAFAFDSATAQVVYENGDVSIKHARFVKGRSALAGEGSIGRGNRFSYKAVSDKILLKDMGLDRMPEDAIISLRSEGSGTFDSPSIKLGAMVAGGTFKGRDMGSGTISAVIQNRNISVEAALFNEKMKLTGSGHLDDILPWNAKLVIQPARYDFLVSSLLKDVPDDLQLNLEGEVDMRGTGKNIEASVHIYRLALHLFGQSFSNDSDIRMSVRNQKLLFSPFAIRSGDMSFRIHGGVEVGREYDIHLDGSSALAPLKGLSRKIGYLKGNADFVFLVSGKWENPEIKGGMTIYDASFGLREYATYISAVSGHIYIDEDRVVVEKLSGKVGGGTVDIYGLAYLKGFQVKRFHLDARLENVSAKFQQDFSVNFDGSLLYRGAADSMFVTGDIRINKARYREMVEWRSWLLAVKAAEKTKSEVSAFEKTELNVRISGGKNITVDNNIARAPVRIRGDMVVKGTVSNPIIFGRLESKEGYIYFRNNEFRILHASADFTDPNRIRPVLNLSAETATKGFTIRLNLEGEADRFSLALFSDPPLEEVDILSLLTVGQLGKQTKGFEGGIGAGAATAFVTGKQQDIIEERIRTLTGIDRFQVEPYVSKLSGTVEPRITVSKRFIGEKVFVTYTTSVVSTEEQVLKVEYNLNRNVSLIGTRDEIGSVGGDVKFRFEFK